MTVVHFVRHRVPLLRIQPASASAVWTLNDVRFPQPFGVVEREGIVRADDGRIICINLGFRGGRTATVFRARRLGEEAVWFCEVPGEATEEDGAATRDNRRVRLIRRAQAAHSGGLSAAEALGELERLNSEECVPPLAPAELRAIITAVWRGCGSEPAFDGDNENSENSENTEDSGEEAEQAYDRAAMISAKRAALRGDSKAKAVARLRKRWPELTVDAAEEIVGHAYTWFKKYQPGRYLGDNAGGYRRITTRAGLNARFARLEVADNPCAIILRAEARPIPDKDFTSRLSGDVIVTGISDKGRAILQSAAQVWVDDAKKHVCRRIALTAKPVPNDTLNLWRGWGVEPRPGDCARIKQHIFAVICAGDERNYEALFNLIAWQLQNIGISSRIITVLISEKEQTGKGSLLENILLRIYGAAGLMVHDVEQITGNFNALLRGKAFIFLDEALFRGDKKAASHIKSLVATREAPLNEKYLPRVTTPLAINIYAASNHEVPVHIEEHDARYWPLHVSPHRRIDNPELSAEQREENVRYWDALHYEIERGGREAFLYEMLHRDVSGFRPQRDIPRRNEAWTQLVRGNIPASDPRLWVEECLEAEVLLYVAKPATTISDMLKAEDGLESMQMWRARTEVAGAALFAGYRCWVGKLRGYNLATAPMKEFWKILTALGFEIRKGKAGNVRVIPEREECRRRLATLLGGQGGGSGDG